MILGDPAMTQPSNLAELVLQALGALHSPDANQRREAVQFLEQLKKGDAHALLVVAGTLTMHPSEEVLLAGFTLLTDLVKNRWSELTEAEQGQVTQVAYKDVAEVCKAGKAAWAIKSKVAVLLAVVVRQQGTAAYAELLPQLLSNADTNTLQAELACMVLHFISEDLTQFDVTQGEGKRQFLAALTASVNTVFPFLCRMLEQHFLAANDARTKGNADEFQAHTAVIAASLSALTTWVEWTPMARISASNVLHACAFFLDSPDFRFKALDVLKQVVSRKRTSERQDDYDTLMDQAAALILADCQKQGFLQPGGVFPESVAAELDTEGSLEEFGQRLCTVLVALGENHFKCLAKTGDRRNMYLQQMLAFTRHRNTQLSVLAQPLWLQLLREALPNVHGGPTVCPAIAAATAALRSGGPASPTGAGQQAAGAAAPGGLPSPSGGAASAHPIRPPSITIPPELCQALITIMAEQLPQVMLQVEDSTSDFPTQFDTFAEYKEFCSGYKGSAKQIVRMATHLLPEQGLAVTASFLSAALAPTPPPPVSGTNGKGATAQGKAALERMRLLDAAVLLLEAAVPAVTDLASQLPAAQEGLASLLQQLMQTRVPDPLTLTPLMARAYETFGRFLLLRPDLTAPLVSACLSSMMCIPLDEAGHLPPPPRLTAAWKRQAEGRLSMCAVVVAMAKAAPAAFIPYLEPLVSEVQKLWAQGLLREGERVLLWEGLMAASVAAGATVQAQILGYILGPVAAQWTSPAWRQRIGDPLAFVAAFLPLQERPAAAAAAGAASAGPSAGDARWALGSRAERWALYHQVTLLERAYRRTLGGAPQPSMGQGAQGDAADGMGAGQGPGGGAGSGAATPICSHLEWSLPVVTQLLHCVHGLWEPSVMAALGPLGPWVTGMDPVERAIRLGEDRDTAKEKEDPRCVAGSSLADARYFVRGIREACIMILSLVATHCGPALWNSSALASVMVPTLGSRLAYLDYPQLRLLHRHVFHAWAVHCPPQLQTQWVVPICRAVLPSMSTRLAADWATNLSSGDAGGTNRPPGAPGEASGAASASDEVLKDALLRESTREHMALLLLLTRPPGTPDPAQLSKPPRQSSNGSPASADAAAGDRGAGNPAGVSGAGESAAGSGAASAGPPVLDILIREDPRVAEAAMRTALLGLCWPDAESAAKAAGVCRYFVSLAQALPSLEPFVCNDLLKTACVSLAQVFAVDIQADVLGLIRAIIVTFMPRTDLVRSSMQQLLQIPDDVFEAFKKELATTGSDSKQRTIIRGLVAQAGNDEVKRVLSSVGKVQPTPPAAAKQAAPAAQTTRTASSDQDQLLGGAIFNMIFSGSS